MTAILLPTPLHPQGSGSCLQSSPKVRNRREGWGRAGLRGTPARPSPVRLPGRSSLLLRLPLLGPQLDSRLILPTAQRGRHRVHPVCTPIRRQGHRGTQMLEAHPRPGCEQDSPRLPGHHLHLCFLPTFSARSLPWGGAGGSWGSPRSQGARPTPPPEGSRGGMRRQVQTARSPLRRLPPSHRVKDAFMSGMRFLSWRFLFKFFTITKQRGLPRNMIYSLSMHQLPRGAKGSWSQGGRGGRCTREPETRPAPLGPRRWQARPKLGWTRRERG